MYLVAQLMKHLLEHVVELGGRLIIGMFTEEVERRYDGEARSLLGASRLQDATKFLIRMTSV